jgi:hypothetical protein
MAISYLHYRKVSKPLFFGASLQDIMDRDGSPVPKIVNELIEALDNEKRKSPGLYRRTGAASDIINCAAVLNSTTERVNVSELTTDEYAIACTLKKFFRDLKDSLIPQALSQEFIDAARTILSF